MGPAQGRPPTIRIVRFPRLWSLLGGERSPAQTLSQFPQEGGPGSSPPATSGSAFPRGGLHIREREGSQRPELVLQPRPRGGAADQRKPAPGLLTSGVASGRVAKALGADFRPGACPRLAAGSPAASPEAMAASRPFHASLLRRSCFGPPAASAQPPHPPCAAMVGIGGCCEGTFCRLDAALPSLCQQIPIGAVRLGPCHPRCLSAFRYMPAKLVHQVHISRTPSPACCAITAGWLLQSGDINRSHLIWIKTGQGMPRRRRSGPGHLVASMASSRAWRGPAATSPACRCRRPRSAPSASSCCGRSFPRCAGSPSWPKVHDSHNPLEASHGAQTHMRGDAAHERCFMGRFNMPPPANNGTPRGLFGGNGLMTARIAPVSRRRRYQARLGLIRVLAANHSSRHPAIGVCRCKRPATDTSRFSPGSRKKRFSHEIHHRAPRHTKYADFPLGLLNKKRDS